MQKVVRRQWIMLTLPGLCVLVVFLISGSIGVRPEEAPIAQAAGVHSAKDGDICTKTHDKPSFGNTVVVDSNEVVCGNLTSFGSIVEVKGEVRGDVVAFGGSVVIDGKIDGNVIVYGGNIALQSQARIAGDFHLCGGQRLQSADSQLHGGDFGCTKSVGQFLIADVGSSFRFWSLLIWLAFGFLLTLLLPEHVMLVRTTVSSKARRSFLLGLLSVLLAPAVIVMSIALIISIPLAIIVAAGLIAAWALGTVAVGWLIGDALMRAIAPHQNTRPMQVVVGLTVLVLAGSLPYIGWLITLGAGLIGLGAVFLSRFGTRLYSQPRQPITL